MEEKARDRCNGAVFLCPFRDEKRLSLDTFPFFVMVVFVKMEMTIFSDGW